MGFGVSQSSVGILTCWRQLRSWRFGGRSGLIRRGRIFRGALCLNLLGVKNAIGAVRAFDQSLCVVLERVWRRFGTAIRNLKLQALLIDLEVGAGALTANAARNHESRHAQPLRVRLIAHALQFLNRDVVTLALLNAGKREI